MKYGVKKRLSRFTTIERRIKIAAIILSLIAIPIVFFALPSKQGLALNVMGAIFIPFVPVAMLSEAFIKIRRSKKLESYEVELSRAENEEWYEEQEAKEKALQRRTDYLRSMSGEMFRMEILDRFNSLQKSVNHLMYVVMLALVFIVVLLIDLNKTR